MSAGTIQESLTLRSFVLALYFVHRIAAAAPNENFKFCKNAHELGRFFADPPF